MNDLSHDSDIMMSSELVDTINLNAKSEPLVLARLDHKRGNISGPMNALSISNNMCSVTFGLRTEDLQEALECPDFNDICIIMSGKTMYRSVIPGTHAQTREVRSSNIGYELEVRWEKKDA